MNRFSPTHPAYFVCWKVLGVEQGQSCCYRGNTALEVRSAAPATGLESRLELIKLPLYHSAFLNTEKFFPLTIIPSFCKQILIIHCVLPAAEETWGVRDGGSRRRGKQIRGDGAADGNKRCFCCSFQRDSRVFCPAAGFPAGESCCDPRGSAVTSCEWVIAGDKLRRGSDKGPALAPRLAEISDCFQALSLLPQ